MDVDPVTTNRSRTVSTDEVTSRRFADGEFDGDALCEHVELSKLHVTAGLNVFSKGKYQVLAVDFTVRSDEARLAAGNQLPGKPTGKRPFANWLHVKPPEKEKRTIGLTTKDFRLSIYQLLVKMKELDILLETIKKAGQAAMAFYDDGNEVSYKDNESPVTKADLASEKVLLEGLQPFNYGVLSEETNEENDRLNKEKTWVIDPLDGTMDFIQKTGDFSIIVGLVENGQPVLGAVYQPVLDRLFYAMEGEGAFVLEKGKKKVLKVSAVSQFSKMKLLASRNHLQEMEVNFSEKMNIKEFVKSGSAGLKVVKVASADGDIYMNTSDKTFEWDICGGSIIIEEAGGVITDMDGNKFIFNKKDPKNSKGFVVSNGQKHQEIIDILKKL